MKNRKKWMLLIDVILLLIFIFLDQLTKYLAVLHLKGKSSVELLPGIFELHYLENRGAAFGMLQNQKIFFIFIAVVIFAAICYIIMRMPDKKKYTMLHILLVLIASGAIGNMIDRIRYDYVVDFLYFSLINFPIFNVADIYVTCSTILLAIVILFVYKEEDLRFLSIKEKKVREIKDQTSAQKEASEQDRDK